jgi:hypothetical protein
MVSKTQRNYFSRSTLNFINSTNPSMEINLLKMRHDLRAFLNNAHEQRGA